MWEGKVPELMLNLLGNLYTIVLAGLAVYALHIVVLIVLYLIHRQDQAPRLPVVPEVLLPTVTVQIPIRNERYVVQRILRAAAALDWPRDRLEIQVLDDSTDDTTQIANREAARLRAQGVDIQVLHRTRPQGYKAGALADGLKQAKGAFVAIFDADFCPPSDFLRLTVPHFTVNPRLGMVQTRWGHLNADDSAVTRAQALLLDAHFTVEHMARNRSGLLMNFNGTAGVWRRQTIEDAGGWQSDTVAEDLDLSYRAQLRGWEVLYLPEVVADAELPPLMAAFKQQQYRWAKGAAQTFRKLIGPILHAKQLTHFQKLMAFLHLSAYITQPLFLLMLLLTLPLVIYNPPLPYVTAMLGTTLTIPPLLYVLGQIALYRDWPRRILSYPTLMLLGVGVAWNNTLALIDGLMHWGGPFVRTPKFQHQARQGKWQQAAYKIRWDPRIIGDFCLGLYAAIALWYAWGDKAENLIPFAFIYAAGEALVIGTTLAQAKAMQRTAAE